MVRFAEDVYVSDNIQSKLGRIKWKTVCGIGMVSVFFITLALSENDLFDIYSAANFKQRGLRKSNLVIIGVTDSYYEATTLVGKLVEEGLKATGDVKLVRKYYEDRIKEC